MSAAAKTLTPPPTEAMLESDAIRKLYYAYANGLAAADRIIRELEHAGMAEHVEAWRKDRKFLARRGDVQLRKMVSAWRKGMNDNGGES